MVFNGLHISILLFFLVGFLMAAGALTGAFFLSPRARDKQMGMSYECGMRPLAAARIRFHINYYIYALIFLAFEVDVLYLFPVALFYSQTTGFSAFYKVFVFLLVLALAVLFFHAKGVFKWPRKPIL
ncbi:MAG: NAD(P)H-quinone oxidoreductase subunit 3 [Deltaproteobacteria bacterium]|jgi:NADH:ubiquinone oxidoreductase subunit 3 (subunit A)|nr:NAD(P)H-quinone oxidoreductase subunit 3 [Deltaproteobacteria bacterium]